MIDAKNVHETLGRHMLADGMPMVPDLDKSHGAWLHDARTGDEYQTLTSGIPCFAARSANGLLARAMIPS